MIQFVIALSDFGGQGLDLQLVVFDASDARLQCADLAPSLFRLSLDLACEVSFTCDTRPKLLYCLAAEHPDLILNLEPGVTFLYDHHLLLRIGELVQRNFEQILSGLLFVPL